MNRRGFIALATAAAVAPQELIAAPEPAPVLDYAAIGSARAATLAQSMLQTREMVAVRFIAPSMFLQELQKMLNEEFSGLYECIPYESIFKDEEALAGEVGSGDSPVLPRWEETERTPEDLAAECRRAGRVYDSLGAGESARPNSGQRG